MPVRKRKGSAVPAEAARDHASERGSVELEGTPACRRFQRAMARKWPRWHPRIYVFACKHIGSGSTWSQHAWGNAIDVMCSGDRQRELAHWAVNHADDLDVETVIYLSKVWSRTQPVWHAYGGTPHDVHVHLDFRPPKLGTPPCAT